MRSGLRLHCLPICKKYANAQLGIIAPDYYRRLIVRFRTSPGRRWLDVRSPETHEHLRCALAHQLTRLDLGDRFVLGDLISRDHRLTRIIAGWALEEGFDGVAYASCHDPSLTCFAIFADVELIPLGEPVPLPLDDTDLREVAKLWNLELPIVRNMKGECEPKS